MSVLKLSISFNGANGAYPSGSLITDADGNLFGTTLLGGGAFDDGTVFEIAKTAVGYASTPTTLVKFNGANGAYPSGSLIADADGNLFGTTALGGAFDDGTVFEIAKTAAGYASTPTTLVKFNGANGFYPEDSLIADANGNLFGTTFGGNGTVFEIAKTATGYASTPTTLVAFNGANGAGPLGSLIADANGNLFGTTALGGATNAGTVFEIAKTATGYASTPTTLVAFNIDNGAFPEGSLIADANGDLFGTTSGGGANSNGTVFEIAKTATGYASTPTTLVAFNGANGSQPQGSLIADANGNLFGTTASGAGATGNGTVFEIAKTVAGYASTPTTLVAFTGANGSQPRGSLIADAGGNLFGTTSAGGAFGAGTVFEFDINGGVVTGDPHVDTFAGLHYDFQGLGDFVLTRSTAAADPFEVQIRTSGYLGGNTIISEAAAKLGDDRVIFDLGRASAGESFVWVDGQASSVSADSPVLTLAAGRVVELSTDHYQVIWNAGEMLDVRSSRSAVGPFIDLNFTPASPDGPGSMAGLLGSNTGGSNDLLLPDGTVLDPQTAASDSYNGFGNAWRVTDGTSLFGPSVTEALASDTGVSSSDRITSNPVVAGSGDPNTTVTISEGSAVLGTTTANGTGAWTFTAPGLADGSHRLTASETGLTGNTGSASLSFMLDTIAPPVTAALISDTGISSSDQITANPAVTGSGDPKATVTISESGVVLGTTTANSAGAWSFTPSGLADGSHTLTASQTDLAGNTGSASLSFTLDTIAPPVTQALVSDAGVSAGDQITTNRAVTGSGDPKATVTISESGVVLGTTTANSAGAWSFTPSGLADGSHTLTASQTDLAGNTGSASLSFTLDTIRGAEWHVAGINDVNGDGNTDIFWVSNTGYAVAWSMNGATLAGVGQVSGAHRGAEWSVVATGDFDGDGKADVLWESNAGDVEIWGMNGPGLMTLDGGVGHQKGDGNSLGSDTPNLLWPPSGAAQVWQVNGTQVSVSDPAAPLDHYWGLASH